VTPRSQPAPRGYTPRTTTRSDPGVVVPTPSARAPAPVQPAPIPSDVGGYKSPARPTPTAGDTGTPRIGTSGNGSSYPNGGYRRPVGGSVRDASGKPAVPTPRDLYDRGGKPTTGVTNNPPIDRRYTPTKPVAPGDVTRKPVETPRLAPRVTPRPKQSVTDRYPTRTPPTVVSPAPAPRLNPTVTAPRLQPRSSSSGSISSGIVGRRSSSPGSFSSGSGFTRSRLGHVRDWWWDPCSSFGSHWNSSWGWSLHGGHGSFGYGVSLWYPWYHYHHHYWNVGYSNCWWNSWSDPYCPSWNYWWYPSTTYCPTYLYVPSSVVYVDYAPAAESDPVPVGGYPVGGYPVGGDIVVGSPVGGSVEIRDGGAADRNLPPHELAKKYVELGDFYFKAGRFDDAEDAYARARTYAPDDASVHFVLADAAFATGDYPFAAFLIGEALRLDPSLVSADTDKRLFYGDPKVFDEQMATLDKYLTEKPYDASAHLVRGYNLRFAGKPTAAVAAFRRVLEIAPEQPAARIFLAALAPADAAEPTIR